MRKNVNYTSTQTLDWLLSRLNHSKYDTHYVNQI